MLFQDSREEFDVVMQLYTHVYPASSISLILILCAIVLAILSLCQWYGGIHIFRSHLIGHNAISDIKRKRLLATLALMLLIFYILLQTPIFLSLVL